MIRVQIYTRQPVSAIGLRAVLAGQPGIELLAGAGQEVGEALQKLRAAELDVAVVATSGSIGELLRSAPKEAVVAAHPVVVVTDHLSESALLGAISSGVRGFVSERAIEDELVPAVHRVAAKHAYLSSILAGGLLDWLAGQLPADPALFEHAADILTPREREVLVRLGNGDSNSEIAADLVISQTTVRSHVGAIMQKLSMPDRTKTALFGYQFKLVQAAS